MAEENDIIILYPQAKNSTLNPQGCWDWYVIISYIYILGPETLTLLGPKTLTLLGPKMLKVFSYIGGDTHHLPMVSFDLY